MQVRFLTRLVGIVAPALLFSAALTAHADPDLDVNVNTTIIKDDYATIRVSPNGSANPPVTLDFGGTAYANVMELYNNGVANINANASIDALVAFDLSSVNFYGGIINYQADLKNDANIAVYGGTINGGIGLKDNAFAAVNGGTIAGDLTVADMTSADLFGGTVTQDVYISQNGTFSLRGGSVGGKITTTDTAQAYIVEGTSGDLYAFKNSLMLFYALPGTFSATPVGPWSYGVIYDVAFRDAYNNLKTFVIYDDDTVNYGLNFAPNDIAAVPEPGAIAFGVLAAGSVLGLVARKRRG